MIGKKPLATLLREKVLGPMGLTSTTSSETSSMPNPVLHSSSSEREVALHIPPMVTFYEEATYWNTVELPRHDRLQPARLRAQAGQLRT